jgi:hypothetical protein
MIKKISALIYFLFLTTQLFCVPQGQGKNDRFTIGYDDLYGDFTNATGVTALGTITIRDTGFPILAFQNANDDFCYIKFQMSHEKVLGQNIKSCHAHVYLPSAPVAGNTIYWDYSYCYINNNSVIPALSSWTTGRSTYTFTGSEAQYSTIIIPVVSEIVPPANETYSSSLLIKITRDSTGVGSDTYNDDLGILNPPDIHIPQDKLGSFGEAFD